jgi:Uri superfamily endonuclease
LKGTYALVFRSKSHRRVRIGRLGTLPVRPGFYVYVGSALGPGGLEARIARHRRLRKTRRWHLDHLRPFLRLEEEWTLPDAICREHEWAAAIGNLPGASIPLPRFGASDCRCPSHLHCFESRPVLREVLRPAHFRRVT